MVRLKYEKREDKKDCWGRLRGRINTISAKNSKETTNLALKLLPDAEKARLTPSLK